MNFLYLRKQRYESSKCRSYILKPALGAARKKVFPQARLLVSLEGSSAKEFRSPSPPIRSGDCEICKRERPRTRMVEPSVGDRTMNFFSRMGICQFRGFVSLKRQTRVPIVTSSASPMPPTALVSVGRDRVNKTPLSGHLLSRRAQKKESGVRGGFPHPFLSRFWTQEDMDYRLLSIDDAARFIGWKSSRLRKAIQRGKGPRALQVSGRRIEILMGDLKEWIDGMQTKGGTR